MSSSPSLPTFPTIPHRFHEKSTAEDVLAAYPSVDLRGKNAIVTGGYSGIGVETVKALLSLGAHVVVPARNVDKARTVVAELQKELDKKGQQKGGQAEVEELDLASLESVRAFAHRYNQRNQPLHLLIDNAGIMALPTRELTKDGFEAQLATNHYGHFLLTNLLLPSLRRGAPSRVVVLSSLAHAIWYKGFHFDDLNLDNSYEKYEAYGRSKFANLAFAKHFNKLHKDEGIVANAVHPGGIQTGLGRYLNSDDLSRFATDDSFKNVFWKSVSQGSATTLYVALSPELEGIGGQYFEDVYFVEKWSKDNPFYGTIPEAFDEELHKKIWDISVQATKYEETQ